MYLFILVNPNMYVALDMLTNGVEVVHFSYTDFNAVLHTIKRNELGAKSLQLLESSHLWGRK